MAPRSRTRTRTRTRRAVGSKPQVRSRAGKKTRVRTRSAPRRSRPAKRTRRKRPLNAFFKLMLKSKRKGDESFVYNGNTYKGKKHPKLRMIYKRV